MELRVLNRVEPIVDNLGRPTQIMQVLSSGIAKLPPIIGDGLPLEVSQAGKLFVNQGAGSPLFLKQVDSVGGDRSLGWVSVGGSHYNSEARFQDFTSQPGLGLDIPTVVKYGPAAASPNGMVSVNSVGHFHILKGGPYLIKSNLRIARTGVGGVSHLFLWVESSVDGINFAPVNVSIRVTIDDNKTDAHLYDSSPIFFPKDTYLRTMIARSSTGTNSGGLYSEAPSVALASYGVGPDPSASLEWYFVDGYIYD